MSRMIQFTAAECRNLDFARSREWLVTNGIGGYASSTIIGMNTRRYHGLLVAATAPPLGRMVLLSHLDETLTVADQSFDLATNLYQGGIVHPMGYSNQTSFQDDFGPSFTWGNGVWELKKNVSMVQGQNAVVVDYVFTSPQPEAGARLEIRPLLAFRDFHGNTRENGSLDATLQVDDGVVSISPYGDAPRLYFAHTPATLLPEASWYRNFDYEQEKNRGLDSTEDLFHPFTLCLDIDLKQSARFTLIVATSPQAINLLPEYDHARTKYMAELSARIPATSASNLVPTLYTAAEQFIVARPPFKTIIAGYHWFGDWGRDTMIAMPGLLLSTGQPEVAKEILQQFLRLVDQGMLPNRFPDSGQQPDYNTVDATLWFFEAIRHMLPIARMQPGTPPLWRSSEMSSTTSSKKSCGFTWKARATGSMPTSKVFCGPEIPERNSPGWTRASAMSRSHPGTAARWRFKPCGITRCASWLTSPCDSMIRPRRALTQKLHRPSP